ncbi:MAG: hypothetical protein JSV84_04350, partial [Gemmatimonadota bacterium]
PNRNTARQSGAAMIMCFFQFLVSNLLYSQAVIPAPVKEYGVNSVPESPRWAQLLLYEGDSGIKPE